MFQYPSSNFSIHEYYLYLYESIFLQLNLPPMRDKLFTNQIRKIQIKSNNMLMQASFCF